MSDLFWLLGGLGLYLDLQPLFNKDKTHWLKPTLMVFGLIGLVPLLFGIGFYVVSYVTSHPSVSRVSGSYHGSFGEEKNTLTLRPDGSFGQQSVTKTGKVFIMKGKWHLNRSDDDDPDTLSLDPVIVGIGRGDRRLSASLAPSIINGSMCFWNKEQGSNDDEPENCFTR